VSQHSEIPAPILDQLRTICLAFPETHEEQAWVGTRWRVDTRTFAHVLLIDAGWPPAYARAAGTDGPAHVLMFRSSGDELEALRRNGPPYFATPWRADELGVLLGTDTAWPEIGELLTESYWLRAKGSRPRPARGDRRKQVPGGA
jgi:hypothetical protein